MAEQQLTQEHNEREPAVTLAEQVRSMFNEDKCSVATGTFDGYIFALLVAPVNGDGAVVSNFGYRIVTTAQNITHDVVAAKRTKE